MNTKRNWVKVAVVVVMAVARLSFTTPVAADLCGVPFVSEYDQYLAATEWAEQGGPVPTALTVSCVEDSTDLAASLADLGGESGVRWEQYMAAIEGTAIELSDQRQAAIGAYWEQVFGWTEASASALSTAEKTWERSAPRQAAIEDNYWDQIFDWNDGSR